MTNKELVAIKTIEQALNRLDRLEKLEEENEKLKTSINILKAFLPDLYFTQSDNSKDVILVYDGGGYCGELTREEYELLKEVLGDE